jgi:MBG domain (YGX type)/YDG domain
MSRNILGFRRQRRFGAGWIEGSRASRGDRHRLCPRFLELEERRLLATFTVTNAVDDGSAGTLRSVIAEANATPGANTIDFDPTVFGTPQTITLAGSELELGNTSGLQTITGPTAGVTINAGGRTRVLLVDKGVTTSISGLTLTGGNQNANGAGLDNSGAVTLSDCTISGNTAPGNSGGGLFSSGTATLINCVVSGNNAAYGGGLENKTGSMTLTGCTVSSNGNGNLSGGTSGGGIYNLATLSLNDCTITGNTGYVGGGLNNGSGGTANLTGCTLSANSAKYNGGLGNSDAVSLTDCTIKNNVAFLDDGGVGNNATANLTNCTISNNIAGIACGGIALSKGKANLTDCTISGNSAQIGGGVDVGGYGRAYLNGCTISSNSASNKGAGLISGGYAADLTDCTITGNSTPGSGGGLYNSGTMSVIACTVSANAANHGGGLYVKVATALTDTIIAGNTLPNSLLASDVGGPSTDSGSYNLFGTGGSGGIQNGSNDNIILPNLNNLGLAPLGFYGGPTQTMALIPGSAAMQKGTRVSGVTTDQRGEPLDSPPDIGAFQVQSGLVVNTTSDGTTSSAGDLSLRQAVALANVTGVAEKITFDSTAFSGAQTIVLDGSPLVLSDTGGVETITGPAAGVTISGGGLSRVLQIEAGVTATLSGLTIGGGSTTGNGGGLYNSGTTALGGVTISGNTANSGGGLWNNGTATLTNCTVSENTANSGGGLSNGVEDVITLTDCTVSDNTGTSAGGGIELSGTAALNNTIVAGNAGTSGASDIGGSGTASGSDNLIGTGGAGGLTGGVGGNIVGVTDAGLAPLGDYGGPTETMALLPTSLAIGEGVAMNNLATDQRGATRSTSGAVDIGAFQHQGYRVGVSSGSAQTTMVSHAFGASLVALLTEGFTSAPIPGVTVAISSPTSGASATLSVGSAVTNASGQASITATANATAGKYAVIASATNVASSASFDLTNQIQPSFSGLTNETVTYGGTVTLTGSLGAGLQVPSGADEEVVVTVDGVVNDALVNSDGTFSTQITLAHGVLNASSTPYNVAYEYTGDGVFLEAEGSSQLTINPEPLTITAVAGTKVYDGTTTATTAVPTITAGSLAMGDTPAFTEAYSTKNVGTGLTLTPSGTVDDGNGGGNYTYTFVPVSTGAITPLALTITAVADTKVYDGTTSATTPVITSGSVASGDTADFIETYDTRNVGTGLTLTPSGTVDDGNGGNNYTYTFVPVSSGVITAERLTITAVANTKVYDGTTSATGAAPTISSGSLGAGDTPAFIETYSTRNVGTGLALTPSGTVADGNGGANYTYAFLFGSTGVITAAPLTITAIADSKVYDGTTSASGTLPTITSGSLATGNTPAFTETYSTKNAGTALTLAASGTVNDGNGGKNYKYTFVPIGTGVITAEPLTITAVADTKMYDGKTSAPGGVPTITSGRLGMGDTAEFTETFSTKNSGTGLTLTPGGTVSDGNGGGNYTYTFTPMSTGVITAAPLTITSVANARVYDGTTNAVALPLITSGTLVAGDTADFIETYSTRNVGAELLLTPSGTVDDGNGGNNYSDTFVPASSGVITARALTISAAANSKVYDGTTSASTLPTITSGALVTGDTADFTETYNAKNAGTGLTLTPLGTVDDGNGGGDYAYTFVPVSTGAITPVALTITAVANTRVYDGTTTATGSPAITSGSLAAGDTADFTETDSTRNVGTGLLLTPNGTVDDGDGGNNYTYTFVSVSTGTITPAPLTVRASDVSSVYGSSLPALTYTFSGFVGGDSTSVVSGAPVLATSAASDANAGAYPITIAAGTLSATNYTFLSADLISGELTVTAAQLEITAVSTSMLAGQAVPELTAGYTGFVNGDSPGSLTTRPMLSTTATSTSAPGGYPITVGGASSTNYTITYVPGTLAVILAPATVEKVTVEQVSLSKHKKVQEIVLQFSEALNSTTAQSINSYTLATLPKKKKQKSKVMPLSRATYNPMALTVTLLTRKKLVLNPVLKLTVKAASLLDAFGRELDGNDSGQPGVNFTAVISKAGATIKSARPLVQIGALSFRAVDALSEAGFFA